VLIHLALNAGDAMPSGGTLRIAVRGADGKIVLSVSDTGAGMAEATRQQATVPFFTTRPGQRTGLGLTTVAAIVKQQHGVLRLDSALEQGTTVTIELPLPARRG
jgi:signal transduction histidine kinase